MHWVLKLLDQCGLDEQHIRGSATSAFMRTKLGFVSSDEDVLERPLFQLIVTALPASSGCAASISARVIAPIEGARFVYDKKPLQKPTYVTIWEDMYGEGGRAIYEPHEQITARIEATIDTLINEFAEAWTHSQGIGHPKIWGTTIKRPPDQQSFLVRVGLESRRRLDHGMAGIKKERRPSQRP